MGASYYQLKKLAEVSYWHQRDEGHSKFDRKWACQSACGADKKA
jgi:hypothetical protein